MRRFILLCLVGFALGGSFSALAAIGHVNKVLPHFLDAQGRHTLSPSLFDRDAYQAKLRQHPELRSGIRFDVNWRVRSVNPATFKLKVELRGVAKGNLPQLKTLEQEVKGGVSSHWTGLTLSGEDYREFGEVTAWRVTLWDGEQLLGEQKSFLW
jgi:hypothetical protein